MSPRESNIRQVGNVAEEALNALRTAARQGEEARSTLVRLMAAHGTHVDDSISVSELALTVAVRFAPAKP